MFETKGQIVHLWPQDEPHAKTHRYMLHPINIHDVVINVRMLSQTTLGYTKDRSVASKGSAVILNNHFNDGLGGGGTLQHAVMPYIPNEALLLNV